MSNTLKTIQLFAKIGKILSTVFFVFCIIAAVGSILGILAFGLGLGELTIGDTNLKLIFAEQGEDSIGSIYTALAVMLVIASGHAVLCKFAEVYFRHELTAGTPFTTAGAAELMRLGILMIAIPIGTSIVASTVHGIMSHLLEDVQNMELNVSGTVILGVAMIAMSFLCRLALEQAAPEIEQ